MHSYNRKFHFISSCYYSDRNVNDNIIVPCISSFLLYYEDRRDVMVVYRKIVNLLRFIVLGVFVHNYPRQIKSFYMRDNDDKSTVDSFDLLVPGIGELIGGSQREERLEVLQAKMAEFGLKESDYNWYLDLRRFGSVPHSGYGLGFERLVCYVTSVGNIREAIAYPRYPKNADF